MTHAEKPVAMITGGGRGIGFGIASALARAGYEIAITDLDPPETAEATLADLRSHGGDAMYLLADIADVAGHDETVQAVLQRFGRIDCLVNNAGIGAVARCDFLELTPANFDRVMSTNLRGAVFFSQAVAKGMLAARSAPHPRSVITITSASAAASSPDRLDYCISKAGLAAFCQGLALRLAEAGIAVFDLRPGIIRTGMTASVAAKYDALIEGGLVPMKRWGEPDDIGAICAALASGAFAFATGSVIDADGGLSIARL
jgi:NAD(P)-dependent dehydrogenase (short-subunit alcohol dehydrogenase family)